jgi:UDP-galactopyranose mutase
VKVLIIGAGFAGAAAAYVLRERFSADVTVLEHGAKPGGMLRTYSTPEGLPYEYGPRVISVFRGTTDSIPFLQQFMQLEERAIYQGTRLRPEYDAVPFPVDKKSLMRLPCGQQIAQEWQRLAVAGGRVDETNLKTYLESTVGPTLTKLAFEPFNLKFWGRALTEIPAEWGKLRRLERIAETGDYRLPAVAPHYYPKGGFNPLFDQLLAGVEVRYNTTVLDIAPGSTGRGPVVKTESGTHTADLVLSTAPIDKVMGLRFGELQWKGYRVETEVVNGPALGRAPDGIPFSWMYSPYLDTPVCRTTDFGVIQHGPDYQRPAVVLRELPDDRVKMYPVWWEDERFYKYLGETAKIRGLIPLGRLGFYKYVTTDSTYAMVQRLADSLGRYSEASETERLDLLRHIRGDWSN